MSFLCQKNNVNIKFITQIIYLRSSILLKYKTNVMSVPEIKLTGDKYFQRNKTFKNKVLSMLPIATSYIFIFVIVKNRQF